MSKAPSDPQSTLPDPEGWAEVVQAREVVRERETEEASAKERYKVTREEREHAQAKLNSILDELTQPNLFRQETT